MRVLSTELISHRDFRCSDKMLKSEYRAIYSKQGVIFGHVHTLQKDTCSLMITAHKSYFRKFLPQILSYMGLILGDISHQNTYIYILVSFKSTSNFSIKILTIHLTWEILSLWCSRTKRIHPVNAPCGSDGTKFEGKMI